MKEGRCVFAARRHRGHRSERTASGAGSRRAWPHEYPHKCPKNQKDQAVSDSWSEVYKSVAGQSVVFSKPLCEDQARALSFLSENDRVWLRDSYCSNDGA